MKRIGFLHEQIYKLENILLADKKARKNKRNREDIIKHDKTKDSDNIKLLKSLKNLSYKTSKYKKFKIYEPKERIIYKLPYYPDRITHHAIMNILESIWTKIFITNTYACIKNRGIHKLVKDLKYTLTKYPKETKYCLKIDIHKFYPSINHLFLKLIIRRKIKDRYLLFILDSIIDSTKGVPIGNYLSQYFANLYLTYFDHWIKEILKCIFYFRYADDIIILSDDKDKLAFILKQIKKYLSEILDLQLKPNYQIFPVDARGIDYVGYKFYHNKTLLRKSMKLKILRLTRKYNKGVYSEEVFKKKMLAYFGWLKYCDSKKFLQELLKNTGFKFSNWNGKLRNISSIYNKSIKVVEVIKYSKYYLVHFIFNRKSYYFNSHNKKLYQFLIQLKYPVNLKINYNENNNRSKTRRETFRNIGSLS